jgi:AcrR family transcriptional regulator
MARSGSRREAILEAMIRVVGEKGYSSTSVADVLAAAGSSRATFYKHFDDKLDCFLTALDMACEQIFGVASEACAGGDSWEKRACRGLAAIVQLFADSPELAQATVAEAATAGAEARKRYWAAVGRLARLIDGRSKAHRRPELPPSTGLMAVAAVAGLIFDQVKEGGAADLPRVLPELEFALLVPYLGPRAAAETCGSLVASASR